MSEPVTPRPLGPDGCDALTDAGLAVAGADDVEVVVQRGVRGVARFAGSVIHQSVATDDVLVNVRVAVPGGRVGVAAGRTDRPADVRVLAERARTFATATPPDPHFAGVAPPAAVAEAPVDEAVLGAGPALRAGIVRRLLDVVEHSGGGRLEAAGACSTVVSELAVATTAGQRAYSPRTAVHLTTIVSGGGGSGFAEAGGRALADVDASAVASAAVAKALAAADPQPVDPGAWPVVLEPAAAATLVQYLAFVGFGGRAQLEGRAFTSGRLGQPVVDESLSIADDALAAAAHGLDYEGTPRQRVPLVQRGTAAGVVHDRRTGRLAGMASTGHGLLAPNPAGPLALHPVLEPGGGGTIASLVGGLERGLVVSRFHYTNVVEPLEAVVTAMTRDGTFVVEGGRVVRAARNLRFTQSLLEALAAVDAVSTETGYASQLGPGGARYPALRLPALRFTSATDH